MRNIFLINPCAGQGKNIDVLISQIEKASKKLDVKSEIYVTNYVGDAQIYTERVANQTKGKEEVCFFACGGDGTLNEVVNGAVGFDHVSVGAVPVGTGNDFVRNFGQPKDFMDVKKQLTGLTKKVDLIKYTGEIEGQVMTRYCINMFNIGFDCNVVDKTAELKKKPLLKGSLAYLVSVGNILIKKKGANLRIFVEGKKVHEGSLLLCVVANGAFCGGGVCSSPQTILDDGKMDINVIRNVSRTKFIKMFPSYSKGTHFEQKGVENTIIPYCCKTARIEPLGEMGTMRLCVDGEISTTKAIDFEVVRKAINFVLPL